MSSVLVLPLGFLIGITVWMAISHVIRDQQMRRQQEIVRRGVSCLGRVVAIQRPFMLESCTRFYFDFAPAGVDRPLRGCHIHRRSASAPAAVIPHTGAAVTVRYLPEQPELAVISKLV